MRKGFISGIALTLLIAVGVFASVHLTSAESDDIWADEKQASSLTGSNAADKTSFPNGEDNPGNQPSAGSDRYVALGDSVAAGLGLPADSTASEQDKQCGRSPQAYAYEVGRQLNRTPELYACSGASSGDLFTRQWISNSNPQVQLDQAFAKGTPGIISITVGANDISWRRMITGCYTGQCGTETQTKLVDAALIWMERNLNRTLEQIDQRSSDTPPTVVLSGYYNPISLQCTALLPGRITNEEVAWITDGVNKLNQRLQIVASEHSTFARFAAVDFSGHDLCSSDPWIQGLSDTQGSPLHPTLAGQHAIARSVVSSLQEYTR